VPALVLARIITVPTPDTAFFALAPSSVPSPEMVNVNSFVAVVTGLLLPSYIPDVIKEVAAPSATMLAGEAVFMTLTGVPTSVVTATVSCPRLEPAVVTEAVPGTVVDLKFIVAMPPEAFFVAAPSNVPGPDTANVKRFVAVVTVLLLLSHTLDVTSEVVTPLAVMLKGDAVLMTFAGEPTSVVTETLPWLRSDDVAVTAAVPGVVIDCKLIVPMPPEAFFVLAPSSVPSPETVNVKRFVALVTGWLQSSVIRAVINEVALPSAVIDAGSAVLISIVAGPSVTVTATVPSLRFEPVAVTEAVPGTVVDLKFIVAMPPEAFFVLAPSSVPSPETVNVKRFVAVVTVLLFVSATAEVTRAVDVPLAIMLVTPAVFTTLSAGPNVVVTSIVPLFKSVAAVVTVAVPAFVVERKATVAMPPEAIFVLAPSSVPSPETVNVSSFVAVPTVLLLASWTTDVIKDVVAPSATMLAGEAVFAICAGPPEDTVTFTAF